MWNLKVEKSVAVLSFYEEPANTMDLDFFIGLEEQLDQISENMNIRVVIIRSRREGIFISGADVNIFRSAGVAPFISKAQQVFDKMIHLEKPVIAAIEGSCLGGGCEFALCCDIRIASETAVFGQPEILYGLIPGGGGIQRLVRLAGRGRALKMLLTGYTYHAAEAFSYGIIDEIAKEGEAFKAARKIARRIAMTSPAAVKAMKKLVNEGQDMEFKAACSLDQATFLELSEGREAKEGLRAALEKRLPDYDK